MESKWIELARTYLGLKEIKGPQNEPKILALWKAAKLGGIKNDEIPWCFTGDTEIMTENGWKRFDALTNELVYQVDDFGDLSLTSFEIIRKLYNGYVFDINHRSIKITCDVGHRWWGFWGKNNIPDFKTLNDITSDGLSIPSVRIRKSDALISDNQLAILAAFISDGKYRYSKNKEQQKPWSFEIEVSKSRKIEKLLSLNPDHVYTQKKIYGVLTKTPLTVFRFKYPDWFDECFTEYKKLSSKFINSLSSRQCAIFLASYAIFDGNGDPFKTILYSGEKSNVDDLLWIATLAGYLPSVQRKSSSGLGLKDAYTITYDVYKKSRHLKKNHIKKRVFTGELFCVRVPQGRIVIKGNDSSPTVTGNCAGFVGGILELVGIKSTRADSARSYLNWGLHVHTPMVGAIVIFERGADSGHVGFVVGRDDKNNLMVLGGNQGDMVSIKPFDQDRVLGYRWPVDVPMDESATDLPVLASNGQLSKNEA